MQDQQQVKQVEIKGEDNFDPKKLGGSIKRGIVNPDLLEERANRQFDAAELELLYFGPEATEKIHKVSDFIDKHPEVRTPMEWFHYSREEKMKENWRRFKIFMEDDEMCEVFTQNSEFSENHFEFCWSYMFNSCSVLHLHQTMFTRSLLTF